MQLLCNAFGYSLTAKCLIFSGEYLLFRRVGLEEGGVGRVVRKVAKQLECTACSRQKYIVLSYRLDHNSNTNDSKRVWGKFLTLDWLHTPD